MTEAGLSDEQLSAELRKWTGASPAPHPVGELLDRHWAAAFAYARLCTDGPRAAGMLTTAAFTRLFGAALRQEGPSAAWRPHLLVAVRRIAAAWDADGRRGLLHPALRGGGTGQSAAARLPPPSGRRLLSRAFRRLPEPARAVLWHTEVESEPLAVSAVLLGLRAEDTGVALRRARARLREECLQAHRELAPDDECRRYPRMLDVTFRRGRTGLDPDLRQHLSGCAHCDRTAEQLARFNDGLGLALAEAVLGWGARGYVAARAADADEPAVPRPAATLVVPPGGRAVPARGGDAGPPWAGTPAARGGRAAHRRPPGRGRARALAPAAATGPGPGPATRRSTRRSARRARRRTLALAVLTAGGLAALPLVLWSVAGSGGTPAPDATAPSRTPGADAASPGGSWAGRSTTGQGARHGRLHNLTSGLCVDVVGERAVRGAETELATCSAAASQQWTYETDALLRSAAAPDLCLDSSLGYSVRLAPCSATGRAGRDIRYDFTLQGVLVPHSNRELALTPAATDGSGALVLKIRVAGTAQRWTVDTASADLRMENVNWGTAGTPLAASAPPGTPGPCATHPDHCDRPDDGDRGRHR
ncbi:hypothetical protein ACE1SV_58560 [Streptomyces sp. E-15]